jgi:hypothetical protein
MSKDPLFMFLVFVKEQPSLAPLIFHYQVTCIELNFSHIITAPGNELDVTLQSKNLSAPNSP